MAKGLGLFAAANIEAGLGMLPPKIPEVAAGAGNVWFSEACIVPARIPLAGEVEIAGIYTEASHFIGSIAGVGVVIGPDVEIERFLLVFRGIPAVAGEPTRDSHRPERANLFRIAGSDLDGLHEIGTGFVITAEKIQNAARAVIGSDGFRRQFEICAKGGQGFGEAVD